MVLTYATSVAWGPCWPCPWVSSLKQRRVSCARRCRMLCLLFTRLRMPSTGFWRPSELVHCAGAVRFLAAHGLDLGWRVHHLQGVPAREDGELWQVHVLRTEAFRPCVRRPVGC